MVRRHHRTSPVSMDIPGPMAMVTPQSPPDQAGGHTTGLRQALRSSLPPGHALEGQRVTTPDEEQDSVDARVDGHRSGPQVSRVVAEHGRRVHAGLVGDMAVQRVRALQTSRLDEFVQHLGDTCAGNSSEGPPRSHSTCSSPSPADPASRFLVSASSASSCSARRSRYSTSVSVGAPGPGAPYPPRPGPGPHPPRPRPRPPRPPPRPPPQQRPRPPPQGCPPRPTP